MSPRKRLASAPRLFAPDELRLERTGTARLRDVVALPGPVLTARELRAQENRATMRLLRRWGAELAAEFRLTWASIEAEREGVTGHYGICYEDGVIRIRLRHAKTGRLLKESSLVDTLCHELAHLRHLNHGKHFRRLYQRILDRARELGYYRPGPRETRPRQGCLFDGACGTVRAATDGNGETATI